MDISTALLSINWFSVIVAALSSFAIGGIWYGPLFGEAWMQEFNFTEEDLKKRSIPKTFGISLLLSFVAALNLELFIGPEADLTYGLVAGLLTGVGWVSTMIGILYLFEMQTLRAYLINAGYSTIALTLMGTILGAW